MQLDFDFSLIFIANTRVLFHPLPSKSDIDRGQSVVGSKREAREDEHSDEGGKDRRRDSSSIPFLLRTRKGIPHLLHYVGNTQRLTTTFGEVRPNNTFEIKEKEIKERPRRQRDHDYDDE